MIWSEFQDKAAAVASASQVTTVWRYRTSIISITCCIQFHSVAGDVRKDIQSKLVPCCRNVPL